MEKEIKINIPDSLENVNLASGIVYHKVMKIAGLKSMEKVIQLIASLNDLDVNDVRKLPIKEIDKVGAQILNVFLDKGDDYDIGHYAIIEIDGIKYGLEPNFNRMETGAYIDITQDILPNIEENLHKLMAVLYRPVIGPLEGDGYSTTTYSKEDSKDVEKRADLFLEKMPYSTVKAVVNFMSGAMKR